MATDSLCLENIDEFIHDENKIVTCKWLSLTLKIHINQAKRLLYVFLEQQKKKKKAVNATYFLAGLAKNSNGEQEHQCLVVEEEELESARGKLSTVTSCHVYSIQRAQITDSNSLYMTDYEGLKENLAECNKYSGIQCRRASQKVVRTTKEKQPAEKAQKDTASDRTVKQQSEKENADIKKTNAAPPTASKGKKADAKSGIAAMFAQSNQKTKADTGKKKEDAVKETAKEKKSAAKKGGVMDFFANAKPVSKEKVVEETKEKPVPKETKQHEKKNTKAQKTGSKKKSHQADNSDEDQPRKKRRRIKHDLFDSSSEEEMEVEAESPIPSPVKEATPEPESPEPEKGQTAETSQLSTDRGDETTSSSKTRRRKRKLVPKTYLDEDGFMVTEKVWEEESTDASEVEEDKDKKKQAPPQKQKKAEPAPKKKASPKKKGGSPAKGKQTSLTSFFKKK